MEKKNRRSSQSHTHIFHNLTGYDAHLFVIELAEYGFEKMAVLPSSERNYISFPKYITIDDISHEVRFLDSVRFLDDGIETLARELPENDIIETSK